ncbi:HAMP domain-containing sensor histidine kinase [Alteromonas sp. KUL49]|uniref:HAMP domain-containing sensor histidine kinase n=1 Tax=Alteromonas sp. KUL49 TaxID=2480798 RepID=UPI00102F02D9|nr:HAMP domain-containing sensor histidine kinase [Alteromonas sp. KUL49]TAP39383.1 HAMP domain-containing histidine kinase [Alteromonas sp. KUL49]GEA12178.1 hypothetical protein KUL49_25530 [Alteromonas sp. KUL49]
MKHLHLGLFGRFFSLFALTTLLLVVFVVLGIFAMSEDDAKAYLTDNQTTFQEILENIAREPLNTEKLNKDAAENRVELMIIQNGERWTTSEDFPTVGDVTQHAEMIGALYFAKFQGKYYLTGRQGNNYASVTSNIMNLIVYPNWMVFWPWVAALVVLTLCYVTLQRLLKPINLAIHSAERLSHGELDYQITQHPKTELSILTRGLNRMAKNLHRLFNAQNDLLLAISHELRSPLARMKISLAMLEASPTVDGLSQDIKHMDDLIAQLLEGERLKQGHAILDLTTFYLPTLIDDLLAEPLIAGRAKLNNEIPEVAVSMDVGRIMFALRNLLKNAIEHSPKDSLVEITITEQTSSIVIEVKDNGPGIPDELRTRIFEPFFRVENIDNRSFNGVGLGLFLCKRIVEAHHGEITVSNNPKGGCTFSIALPASLPL